MRRAPNLLALCYFYPPAATGVRRILSLVRHLPTNGWRPAIVACRDARGAGRDEGPMRADWFRAAPISRTESLDPYRLMERLRPTRGGGAAASAGAAKATGVGPRLMAFLRRHVFVPDDRILWVPFAVLRGAYLARRLRLRAIYSSNYPQSAHVAAWAIARLTGLPWLADFRDGWTQNPAFHDPGNFIARRLQAAGERLVARSADALVTVSPPITRHLQRWRRRTAIPAETIYNGFDEEELRAAAEQARALGPIEPGRTTLLYTGTFFGRRRPDLFLHALAGALRHDGALRDRVRVRMMCALDERERALLDRLRLGEVVRLVSPVPFAECLVEQARADCFLLVLERGPGSDIMVSQKVFEYLGAGRPILALVPPGAAAEVLAETGGATIEHANRPAPVARTVARFLNAVVDGTHPAADRVRVQRFGRAAQAAAIAALLDRISTR